MAKLTICELAEALEKVSGDNRTVDLCMAAAGKLKEADELRNAVECRADAIAHQANSNRAVDAAVAKLRANTVNVRED